MTTESITQEQIDAHGSSMPRYDLRVKTLSSFIVGTLAAMLWAATMYDSIGDIWYAMIIPMALALGCGLASITYSINKNRQILTEEGERLANLKAWQDHQNRLLNMTMGAQISWDGWEVTRVPGGWVFRYPVPKGSAAFVPYTTDTSSIKPE